MPLPLLAAVDPWIVSLSALTVLVTVGMGFWAAGRAKSASDFFVAGRGVSVGWNASAISGEYLSAASFMGVAGMVMSSGYDALWYPVCYACGYLFLLLFIAGPLRRFGAYTIPDFAEGRYDSPLFRKIAVVFVLFIGFFYTMPQMKGAGTTLAYVFQEVDFRGGALEFLAPHGADGGILKGFPYWAGVVVVGTVITLNVALGGMKGITLVQAFQYWAKMFAISVPVFVLMAVHGHYGRHLEANASGPAVATVSAPAGLAGGSADGSSRTDPAGVQRAPLPAKAPADPAWLNPFGPLTSKAAKAAKLDQEASRPYALLYTYSLIIALVCGTAGLPHILVRFYTNPDGVAAKRTTMWVMILIGVFYVFPPVFGAMGRNLLPALYEGSGAKGTDKIVLELPKALDTVLGGSESLPWGSILSGMTCAGAFAAFMSTFSGLLVSMTGALAHDVYGRILRPQSTAQERMRMFKWCAVLLGTVSTLLGCFVEQLQINFMVGQAFAIAAASYFPLLFMSVWWRGMTMTGAATGMLTGGICALLTVALTNFSDLNWLPLAGFWAAHPLLRILCEQPAIWCVPMAIGLMVAVSRLTAATVPADIRMKMLVLHAPEALGLRQEYIREHDGH
ncbi:MAG: cation acetate symporter [Verrucomicrobia bacterium]|nr:cation acetate symporter [Verrucomicrobiota bacterium]